MIVFNTTYLVTPSLEKSFLSWLSEEYIPKIRKINLIHSPRLMKVLTDETEGISFSLQWEADNVSVMNQFKKNHLSELEGEITQTFGEKVLFFSTYLKVYDIEA